jgi:hypothetical protein
MLIGRGSIYATAGALTGLFTLILVPLMLMNIFGGIVSGVWLVCVGEWRIVGVGLLVGLFGVVPISIAIMPSLLFAVPAANLIERGSILLGVVLGIPATLYTVAVMAGWSYLVFSVAFSLAAERQSIPILLWSYGVAAFPWSYMASEENRASEGGSSTMYAFFVSLAYLLMVLLRIIGGAGFSTCVTALLVVMVIGVLFQFVVVVASYKKLIN